MRSLAFVMLGLFACADEEKLAELEKKVTTLESDHESARKDFDDRIDDLESRRKDLLQQLEDYKHRLDKLESRGSYGSLGSAQQRPNRPPQPDASKVYSVPVDGYPSTGRPDAKVTIVEAYDYACPFCERSRTTIRDLREKYRGDVRIVYAPLVVHPNNAMAGALAVCAADKQGKFKEMDAAIWDKGFNASRMLDPSDVAPGVKCWDQPDGCKLVVGYARDLGLSVTKFKQHMRDCAPTVAKAMSDFHALGVAATPAFFINGRFLSGAVPVDTFAPIVDEELRKANERIASGTHQRSYYDEWVVQKGDKTLGP